MGNKTSFLTLFLTASLGRHVIGFIAYPQAKRVAVVPRNAVEETAVGAQCESEVEVTSRVVQSIESGDIPVLKKVDQVEPPLTTLGTRRARGMQRRAGSVPKLNGWVPDAQVFCYGLPGATAPLGNFDPLQFSTDATLQQVRRYREAEIMHCRLSMIAVIGWLAAELIAPVGPAHLHINNVPGPVLAAFTIAVGIAETVRARRGWVEPEQNSDPFEIKATYYPGDLNFDPAGFKPSDPNEFALMQTKELNNGRLACIAWVGILFQELTTDKTIADTFHDLFSL